MKMTLINYLRERFPQNFIITLENQGIIVIRDSNSEKGKGYKISVTEENRYIEGLLDFEDYAKELSEYARTKLDTSNNEIISLFTRHRHLYATIHKYTVETLFAPETAKPNGWSLTIGYRKNDAYPIENFADLLLAFILFLFPYDVAVEEEGISHSVLSTYYERSFINRSLCIAYHGYHCNACGESMRDKYGDVARKFIHIHHLNPISFTGQHSPDPVTDMVPLCPNCHSVAHLNNPPYTVAEIKNMLKKNNENIQS
jgi:predicted HNH restriction endonuclease